MFQLATNCNVFLVLFVITTREAVAQSCSVKKTFLKNSQNSQENTCAGFSFLIKLQARGLLTVKRSETPTQMLFCEFCKTFKNNVFKEQLRWLLLLEILTPMELLFSIEARSARSNIDFELSSDSLSIFESIIPIYKINDFSLIDSFIRFFIHLTLAPPKILRNTLDSSILFDIS